MFYFLYYFQTKVTEIRGKSGQVGLALAWPPALREILSAPLLSTDRFEL